MGRITCVNKLNERFSDEINLIPDWCRVASSPLKRLGPFANSGSGAILMGQENKLLDKIADDATLQISKLINKRINEEFHIDSMTAYSMIKDIIYCALMELKETNCECETCNEKRN